MNNLPDAVVTALNSSLEAIIFDMCVKAGSGSQHCSTLVRASIRFIVKDFIEL